MTDLWGELADARKGLDQCHLYQRLIADVGVDAILKCGGAGITNIANNGPTYQPVPDGFGTTAVIIPVFNAEAVMGGCWIFDRPPNLIDLVAFQIDRPNRWSLRRDTAVILGEAAVGDHWMGQILRVRKTPLSWLRDGCRGVVPLGDDKAARAVLPIRHGKFQCEDDRHGAEIERRLTLPGVRPLVFVPRRKAA